MVAARDKGGDAPKWMVTGPQLRSARSLLGWSVAELAERAGVSYPTVHRAERAAGTPRIRVENLLALVQALEDGGVVFLAAGDVRSGGPGVRLR